MSVELGFETIGNATITVFDDGKPIITTDPWVVGKPYFGSWDLKYCIPKYQTDNIFNAKYCWLSHGHPDHLDIESLNLIKESKLLVPDHFGGRIYRDLKDQGFDVMIIKSNTTLKLSKNISIKSFADYNQDGALLIDIAGEDLILNLNDGTLQGIRKVVLNETTKYKNRFLLRLNGAIDADMVNLFDINGNFLNETLLENYGSTIGPSYDRLMKRYNCNFAIPFSAFHQYQREDSAHMNKYIKPLSEHYAGFENSAGSLLPAFIIWNSEKKEYKEIKPKENTVNITPCSNFGDNWSDLLDKNDIKLIEDYFYKINTIKKHIGIIHFICGGKTHSIKLSKGKNEILFEVPRNSLIEAIKYKVFDDLLIGNFMKTTLINLKDLYPYFTPYVAKYSDNGGASSHNDYKSYIKYYSELSGSQYHFIKEKFTQDAIKGLRYNVQDTITFNFARYVYRLFS